MFSTPQDPFKDIDIPPELEASLQRHREHLADLIGNLRQAGVSEEQIEISVNVMVESYRAELLQTIKALRRRL